MSFFGFDTSLPSRDRAGEREDAAVLGGGLGASAQEDVEVYTWGEEAYDDLADRLQEDGDDFNQDTFGDEEIDNQFDFMGQTAAQASVPPQQQQQQRAKSGRNEDKFKSSNLDDFWGAPNSGFGQSGGLGEFFLLPPSLFLLTISVSLLQEKSCYPSLLFCNYFLNRS